MSSLESSKQPWQALALRDRIEVAVVHIHVTYDRRLASVYTPVEIERFSDVLRDSFHTIAEHRGGKLLSWNGNIGAFMFLVEDSESHDNCCLAAIQMLGMIPSLNEDLRPSDDIAWPIELRLSCDVGMAYGREPLNMPSDVARKLATHGKQLATENSVTITDRIYQQLSPDLKQRFESIRFSAELEAALYTTPPLAAARSANRPGDSTSPSAMSAKKVDQIAIESKVSQGRIGIGGRRHTYVGPWPIVALVLVAILCADLLILRPLIPPASSQLAPAWKEQVYSAEWRNWRRGVQEKLSRTAEVEESVAEAIRSVPPVISNSPAAALRHDEAVADVLLSYPRVRNVLYTRLGIGDKFLGTGLSNPVNVADYGDSSVHEYLIPNKRDDHPQVWMRQLNPIGLDKKKVKDLINQVTSKTAPKAELREQILAYVNKKERLTEGKDKVGAVIRFQILNLKKGKYSGSLGRMESWRVFASDLAEVWELDVKSAADLSGYSYNEGDTFFVWVFVPVHADDAVQATWSNVLAKFPQWVEEATGKMP